MLHRADAHERMLAVWRSDLGKSSLATALPGGGTTPAAHDTTNGDAFMETAADVDADDQSSDDDKSSIYSTFSDVEDEPSAEVWDDMIGAADSDGEIDNLVRLCAEMRVVY